MAEQDVQEQPAPPAPPQEPGAATAAGDAVAQMFTKAPEGERPIDRMRRLRPRLPRKIVVEEYGWELYFSHQTVADLEYVAEKEPKTQFERSLHIMIHKAKLADGAPAFRSGDLEYLRTEADVLLLSRIFDFMYETAFAGIAADQVIATAKEMLQAHPTSAPA